MVCMEGENELQLRPLLKKKRRLGIGLKANVSGEGKQSNPVKNSAQSGNLIDDLSFRRVMPYLSISLAGDKKEVVF